MLCLLGRVGKRVQSWEHRPTCRSRSVWYEDDILGSKAVTEPECCSTHVYEAKRRFLRRSNYTNHTGILEATCSLLQPSTCSSKLPNFRFRVLSGNTRHPCFPAHDGSSPLLSFSLPLPTLLFLPSTTNRQSHITRVIKPTNSFKHFPSLLKC